MDWGGQAGPFKRVNVRSHPSAPARWEWEDRCRHPVKRSGRTVQPTAVREASRSDGRWRRWDSGLHTPGNSSFGCSILTEACYSTWARKLSIAGVSVDRRPCRSLLGMDLTGHWRVSMGMQCSRSAPARPRAVLVHHTTHSVPQNFNAQRKQTSATNTSDALYASVEMNTTFHITVDYTSYSNCTICASPYVAKKKRLTYFRYW